MVVCFLFLALLLVFCETEKPPAGPSLSLVYYCHFCLDFVVWHKHLSYFEDLGVADPQPASSVVAQTCAVCKHEISCFGRSPLGGGRRRQPSGVCKKGNLQAYVREGLKNEGTTYRTRSVMKLNQYCDPHRKGHTESSSTFSVVKQLPPGQGMRAAALPHCCRCNWDSAMGPLGWMCSELGGYWALYLCPNCKNTVMSDCPSVFLW